MDSTFDFLSIEQVQLLNEILARRNPALAERVRRSHSVSRSDAEQIVVTLSEEFTDHLDDDWEPTEYGKTVNRILAQVNAVQIQTWPE